MCPVCNRKRQFGSYTRKSKNSETSVLFFPSFHLHSLRKCVTRKSKSNLNQAAYNLPLSFSPLQCDRDRHFTLQNLVTDSTDKSELRMKREKRMRERERETRFWLVQLLKARVSDCLFPVVHLIAFEKERAKQRKRVRARAASPILPLILSSLLLCTLVIAGELHPSFSPKETSHTSSPVSILSQSRTAEPLFAVVSSSVHLQLPCLFLSLPL